MRGQAVCDTSEEVGIFTSPGGRASHAPKVESIDLSELMPVARALAGWPENRESHTGFIGYGKTKAGDKVLIAVDREYDPDIPEALAAALREKGAHVDILRVDLGDPEREFDELDEVKVTMRREPWERNPRRWEGIPYVEEFAARTGYDLLIHGKGGPIPKTDHRYEQFPWLRHEHFRSHANTYPLELHLAINTKTWDIIWEKARGGRARLTDAEGTDITWTYWEEYYDGTRRGFSAAGRHGHLHSHPVTPLIAQENTAGVVAGTTSHFARAFPHLRVELDAGQIVKITGGGRYGDAWRDLLEEGNRIQYPCFPRPGLFYLWEAAIGTNPKIARPGRIHQHGSGGFEWERRRSGVIHMGFGTRWRGPEERWAGERGLLYGHLHIHLLFPSLVITAKNGREYRVIDHGRLTALDDPDVRELAAKYGDPDELLKEDWVPEVPGVSCPGSYAEYARDPAAWIYGRDVPAR